VVAGGGARNGFLVERVRHHCSAITPASEVLLSDDLGVPAEAREAMGFAVLGALSQDGIPITLPAVTGAKNPGVAGTWAGLPHSPR
jgi:anhydro-N-acetylmuramic acid kinase